MQPDVTSAERTFLVIQPDPIVCLDLAETLKSAFPNSTVDFCQLVTEASHKIAAAPASACILVSGSLLSERTLATFKEFVTRGVQLIFVGAVDGVDFPAAVVDMPFTTEMILDVLA